VSKTRLAVLALLGVGFTWGAAFVLMKDAIEQQPYMDFLATRFTLAALAMVLLRPRVALNFKAGDFRFGGLIGVVLAFGYITQTIGLELTTAATSGFLTGLYVILTPLIAWLFVRQKVSKRVVLGLTMAMVGLGIFSGAATNIEFQVGQIWLVVCAVLYAVHILLLGHYGKGRSSYRFAMLQIAFAAIAVLAFWVQTWAQTLIEPSRVALLITSEVIFTAIIAVFVGQEPLTYAIIFGGGLLFAAMLVVEWPSKRPETPLEPQLHE